MIVTIADAVITQCKESAVSTNELSKKIRNYNNYSIIDFLWPPYGIGQAIIFLPCGFLYLLLLSIYLFFPRLISAVAD